MKHNALIVWGGWQGHGPEACAGVVREILTTAGVTTDVRASLDVFADAQAMSRFDLIVPVWTMGTLSPEQAKGLMEAVKNGAKLAGFHGGMGDAFRANTEYQFMVGGQFVAHPGGIREYEVKIVRPDHPLMKGLDDFKVVSEQYYMHVDPTNEVLATTRFDGTGAEWIAGAVIPVVWTRRYGAGQVFYMSLGHVAEDFKVPEVHEILRRGLTMDYTG